MSIPDEFRPVVGPSLMFGVMMLAGQFLVVVTPSIRIILDLDPGPFGWLLSSWLVSGTAGSLIAGWLADRRHINATVRGMALLASVSFAICALQPAYAVYATGFALIGLGFSGVGTLCNVAVARSCPTNSRQAITWLQITAAVGGLVGPVAWAAVLEGLQSAGLGIVVAVRVGFIAAGAISLGTLPLMLAHPLPNMPDTTAGTGQKSSHGSIFGTGFIVICVFVALHTGADNGMFVWLPDFIERHYQPLAFPAAWVISAYSGAYLVGRLALTTVSSRVNDLTILGVAPVFASICVIVAFQSESQYVLTIAYIVAGLAMSVHYPAILSHIGREFPHATGRLMAVAGAVSGFASFVVPPAIGYVGEASGTMRAGMMLPAAMLLLLAGTAWLARARARG